MKYFCLLIFICCITFNGFGQSNRLSDSLALVDLYNATGGVSWTYTATVYDNGTGNFVIPNAGTAWDFTQAIDTWHGVELNSSGSVVLLALNSNNLSDTLIDINLPNLIELYLYSNQLSGSILDFTNLGALQYLSLNNNQLTGSIPDFTDLGSLKYLRLGDNQLTGSIPDFANLANLRHLRLNSNQLTGSIPDFTTLADLQWCQLNNNQLSGTIPDFTNLPNLQWLWLYGNQLTGSIPDFTNLGSLQWLWVENNQLSGSIPDFTNLAALQDLRLSSNQLTGSIPDFTNIPNLQSLYLYDNQLSGSIPDFTNIPALQNLSFSSNQLTGSVPDFTNIPNLQGLILNGNQLSGSVPDFTNLAALQELRLYSNQLTGTIPDFTNLAALKYLWLSINQLTGSIPDFTNLPTLQQLYLANNQLSGTIPDFSDNLTALTVSSLQTNSFTFADITPSFVANSFITFYLYVQQDSAGTAQNLSLNTGDTYTLDLGFDDAVTSSTYTWYKDGTLLGTTTTNQYTITNAQFADAGQYDVQITNSVATALTLYARPITIDVCPKVGIMPDTVLCNGSTLTLDAQNSGASYLWSTGATTQTITVSASSDYIVEMTYGSCTVNDTVSVELADIAISTTQTAIIPCFGQSTGQAIAFATDGVSTYTYSWSSGQTAATIGNLGAGIYYVTATDVYGCTDIDTLTITEPTALTSTITYSDSVSCFGGTDGTAKVAISGGTPIYTYLWDNGEAVDVAIALNAGTHSVTATDENGCSITETVTIATPAALSSTLVITSNYNGQSISCEGAADAAANLTVSGGTAPYFYSWSNGNTAEDLLNVGTGTYTVTITDYKGCIHTDMITITEPTVLSSTVTYSDSVSCFGDSDGTAKVTISGGTPIYTYLWDNGEAVDSAVALNAGTHSVTATDANGCNIIETVTIATPAALAATLVITSNYNGQSISCAGSADAAANLTVIGGTAPYTYSWSNGNTAEDLLNVSAGTYTVTITDAKDCIATQSITITEPTALTSTITYSDSVSCFGSLDGTAKVLISGGTPIYTYLWDNGEAVDSAIALNAGAHSVTATDANGCSIIETVTIATPTALSSTLVITSNYNGQSISCEGAADAAANLTVTNGTSPYAYNWTSGNTAEDLLNVSAGTYSVTITDYKGCIHTDMITITEPTALAATTTTTADTCNQAVGTFAIQTIGGVLPYAYDWGAVPATSNATGGLLPDTYTISITDANDCALTVSDAVQDYCDSCLVFSPIVALFDADFEYNCLGGGETAVLIDVTGGQPAYNNFGDYTLSLDINGTISTQTNSSGSFSFQVQNNDTWTATVTDASECSAFIAEDVFTEDTSHCDNYCALYPVELSTNNDTIIIIFQAVQLLANTNAPNVIWSPDYRLTCTDCTNPIATPEQTTEYIVTAARADGCVQSDTVLITVFEKGNIDSLNVPTVFIPTDGPLVIEGINLFPNNRLYLMNRWGQVIYDKQAYDNSWDGRIDGTLVAQDTYYYLLDTNQSGAQPIAGSLLIIRKE